jgi:hypothetical protein
MGLLIACGVISITGLLFGAILGAIPFLTGEYEDAWDMMRFGIGIAIGGPIAIIVGAFLHGMMI